MPRPTDGSKHGMPSAREKLILYASLLKNMETERHSVSMFALRAF